MAKAALITNVPAAPRSFNQAPHHKRILCGTYQLLWLHNVLVVDGLQVQNFFTDVLVTPVARGETSINGLVHLRADYEELPPAEVRFISGVLNFHHTANCCVCVIPHMQSRAGYACP